jgi:predicted NBD/HSP70 family sugar kinase
MQADKPSQLKILGVEDVRDTNETRFLHVIRNSQPVSRADLAKTMGLRAGTVSVVVNRLLRAGFIYEGEEAPSSGGRPATYLQVNAEKAYAVALDIGVHQTVYVVSDFNGRVLSQRALTTQSDAHQFLADLGRQIANHLATTYRKIRVEAIGVSVPGLVDRVDGVLVTSPNVGWENIPVRSILEQEIGLPVHVENDANAAALSELWYGPIEVSNAHSLLFVLVVEGIGTGFIFNGELHVGTRIGLGGFGHLPMDPQGPSCTCGNVGCWEVLASDEATIRRFDQSNKEPGLNVRTISDLITLAQKGHADAKQELLTTASWIGKGVRALAQGLAPEVIIIGGQITRAWPLVEPVVQQEIKSLYLVPGVSRPQVRTASVEQPSLFGAIPLALRSVLKNQNKSRLVERPERLTASS